MAIEIMNVGGSDLMAPVIYCDYCGERITDAAQANVEYLWAIKEQRTPYVKFLHRRCSTPFRLTHRDYPADGTLWLWERMTDWLDQLEYNLGIRNERPD